MINKPKFGITTITIFFLLVINSACTLDPMKKAKSLFAEKKYDLAMDQLNKAIERKPDKVWAIADTCFAEGAKLLRNGNGKDAYKFYKNALGIIQSHSLPFPPNFYSYFEAINYRDSVLNLVFKLLPIASYNDLSLLLMRLYPLDSKIYSANCLSFENGYSRYIWLIPSDTTSEFKKRIFGLASFNPKASNILTNTNLSSIISISPKAFIRSVQEDMMFLTEDVTNDLRFSSIPELRYIFAQLRKEDELQIAAEKDRVINEIVKVREKYLIANLKYIFTKFEILGKCFAYKENYNVDSQEIDLHLSINFQTGGIYIATVRASLSLKDAQKFFEKKDNYSTTIRYKVSPGIDRKNLGISGGGVPNWIMPNLFLFESPLIQFDNFNGFVLNFKTVGLQGELWPFNVETFRWDLNKADKPYVQYKSNVRIIKGIRI